MSFIDRKIIRSWGRRFRWASGVSFLVVAAIGGALWLLSRPATEERLCHLGVRLAGDQLGLRFQMDRCRLDPLGAEVEIWGLRGTDPHASDRSVAIRRLRLKLRPLQAFVGGLQLETLEIEAPQLHWSLESPKKPALQLPGPCWTQLFRFIHLEDAALTEGSVDLTLGKKQLSAVGLSFHSRLEKGIYQARLSGEGSLAMGRGLSLSKMDAAFELDPRHDRITLRTVTLAGEDLTLNVTGTVSHLCHPKPELHFSLETPLSLIAGLVLPKLSDTHGRVKIDGSWNSSRAGPAVDVTAALQGVEVEGYRLSDTQVTLQGDPKQLKISQLHLDLDLGSADLTGEVGIGGNWPLVIDADIHGASFARTVDRLRLRHSLVDFIAEAHAHLSGHLSHFLLTGEGSGEITDFRIDDRAWDALGAKGRLFTVPPPVHFQLLMRVDSERFRFEKANFRSPQSEINAEASIYYDGHRGLQLQADFPRLSLTELGTIARIPWSGEGTLHGSVEGPYDDLTVRAQAELGNFVFSDVDFGRLTGPIDFHEGRLSFSNLLAHRGEASFHITGTVDFNRDLFTEGTVDIARSSLQDLLGAFNPLGPAFPQLQAALAGSVEGKLTLRGPLLQADGEASLTFDDLSVFGRQLHRGVLEVSLERGKQLRLEKLSALLQGGKVSLTGTLTTGGQLTLMTEAHGMPLGPLLNPTSAETPPAEGSIDLQGTLEGTLSSPRPSGSLTIHTLQVLGIPLGTAHAHFSTQGQALQLGGSAGDELQIQGLVQLRDRFPYQARIEGSTLHLERYLTGRGFADPPNGELTGRLELKGDLLAAERSHGDFTLDRLELFRKRLRLGNQGPVRLELEAGRLRLLPAVLAAGRSHLEVVGELSSESEINANVHGDLDARELDGLLPHVERLDGLVHLRADVRGRLSEPAIIGSVAVDHGQFAWVGLPLSVRNLAGSAEFTQRKAVLDQVNGDLNGGGFELGGAVDLRGFDFAKYDLTAQLRSVSLRIPETLPSRVSGQLSLTGDPAAQLLLSGELHVERARYTKNAELENLLSSFQSEGGWKLATGEEGPPLRFDIRLRSDGDLRVENDLAQLALAGDVRLTGTSESPGLLGTLTGKDGLADFRGNQYHISLASLTFDERERIAPIFDVTADTDVRQYRVFVHAFGRPEDYKVQLRSQPSLTEEDIVKLLTFGITSQDAASLPGLGGKAGYVGDVLWNISGLHDQVRRFLPRNQLIKDFSFNLGSAFLEATGQVEPVAQIESRVVTDRLRLRAQLPLSEAAGKRAQAEYQLNDHLSLQGEWNNDYSDYNVGDFGMDLRARWEFGD